MDAEENNVRVISGNNFVDQIKGKNVFVFFYAPWCGHCKSSKPLYETLKDKLEREDVVISKFDATENDIIHPKISITGYPSFWLFKANDYDNPIVYKGGRTVDDWTKFINETIPSDTDSDVRADL